MKRSFIVCGSHGMTDLKKRRTGDDGRRVGLFVDHQRGDNFLAMESHEVEQERARSPFNRNDGIDSDELNGTPR